MLIQITVDVDVDTFFFWKKHYFSPYILESQSIQSLHFDSSQFCPCYFQFTVNLIFTINLLMENVYGCVSLTHLKLTCQVK